MWLLWELSISLSFAVRSQRTLRPTTRIAFGGRRTALILWLASQTFCSCALNCMEFGRLKAETPAWGMHAVLPATTQLWCDEQLQSMNFDPHTSVMKSAVERVAPYKDIYLELRHRTITRQRFPNAGANTKIASASSHLQHTTQCRHDAHLKQKLVDMLVKRPILLPPKDRVLSLSMRLVLA